MKTTTLITLLSLLMFISCDRNAHYDGRSSGDDHDHAHDDNLYLTAYSETLELFAEARPFVVGQESFITAHFSTLDNFRPLAEGSVTASLAIGSNVIQQTLPQPTNAGIYRFSLTPASAGTGTLVFDIHSAKAGSQIIVPGITIYTSEHEAFHTAADMAPTSSSGAVFTKAQSWKVDFATSEARRGPFGQVIRTTAQIQLPPGDEWTVAAQASGVLSFQDGNLVEGKAVSARGALFATDGSQMAENDLPLRHAEAENEYNRAKAELARAKDLAVDKIVSQSELLQAMTDFANAEAAYNNSLQKNFATGRRTVYAPVSGYVTRVLAQNGEFVEAGQPVLSISQNRGLMIRAELQPRHFDILGRIESGNIRLPGNGSTYTLEELGGRLVSYGKVASTANPLIPVSFSVNNQEGFLPGTFVELFIKTSTSAQAITVPNEAIIEEMGNYFVYVQLTAEFFEKRAIRIGATDGFRTEITEGVSDGERVVSKGAMMVKLAQVSGALDPHAGHVH